MRTSMRLVLVTKRSFLTLLLLALLTGGLAGQALAGKPLEQVRYTDGDGPNLDAFLTAECGVEVFTRWSVTGTFTLFDDFSGKDQGVFEAIYSADGKRVIERDASTAFFTPDVVTDNGDGTTTITWSQTFKGLPLRWMQPGSGVLLRDAGRVTFDNTLVIDGDSGDEISFDQQIRDVKGPHPFLDLTVAEQLDILCGALA